MASFDPAHVVLYHSLMGALTLTPHSGDTNLRVRAIHGSLCLKCLDLVSRFYYFDHNFLVKKSALFSIFFVNRYYQILIQLTGWYALLTGLVHYLSQCSLPAFQLPWNHRLPAWVSVHVFATGFTCQLHCVLSTPSLYPLTFFARRGWKPLLGMPMLGKGTSCLVSTFRHPFFLFVFLFFKMYYRFCHCSSVPGLRNELQEEEGET